jgi:leader peptidase (prepilin peptidase) / N-methyltransferase
MSRARLASAALAGIGLGTLGLRLGLGVPAVARLAVLGGALGILVLYDVRERRIPNRVVGPAILACSVLSIVEGVRASGVAGGAVLVAVILLAALARPAWVGMGDAKLAVLLLAGLHGATPLALLFGVELAAVIALAVALRRGRIALAASLPLAPFMAAGSLLALLL